MDKKIIIKYLTLLLSAVFLFTALKSGVKTVRQLNAGVKQEIREGAETGISVFENDTVRRAVNFQLFGEERVISWKGSSPFRPVGKSGYRAAARKKRVKFKREKLVLNGTLQKDNPLALLEDERGKTYIRTKGEEVLGRTIVRIADDSVVIRDPAGREVLHVSEKK